MYLHEFSKAQDRAFEAPEKAKEFFDFKWRIKKDIILENRIEGIIEIDIPYKIIWFNAESDILKTILDVRLELKDSKDNIVWRHEEAFEIAVKDEEPGGMKGKKYKIEIPLILNQDLTTLRMGKNLLYVVVRNRTGNEEVKKVMEFKMINEETKIL